jgi:hypothetical protein
MLYNPTGNGGWAWYNAASGTAGATVTLTQAMTLDASGNLGVGTTSANTTLHVQGAGTTDGSIKFNNQLASTGAYNSTPQSGSMVALKYDSSGNYAGMGGWSIGKENATDGNYSSYFAMHTRANGGAITESARIDSSGNLRLNGVGAGGKVSALVSGATECTYYAETTNASFTGSVFQSVVFKAANTDWKHFIGYASIGGTTNIVILGNGNLQNTNNSYGAISDAKLKENIVDASPKLADLMQVKIRNYNLKGEYEQHKQIGVVAQELETVFPAMVEETTDRDKEGNDLGTITKSVKYSVFVPMLIKAMQEQQAIIESLTQRIATLEAK